MYTNHNEEPSKTTVPYTTPELRVYGGLTKLTNAGTGGGKVTDGTFSNKTH